MDGGELILNGVTEHFCYICFLGSLASGTGGS